MDSPRPIRYLTLWPTLQCNLRCAYCYAHQAQCADRDGLEMPLSTAFAALALCPQDKPFHVQLAGGDPCLAPNVVMAIVAHVRSRSPLATVALQTNGTRMTVALARFLREHHVEVGVSMDGPLDVQERLRGSAKDTLRGLALLNEEGVTTRVTAVLTSHNALRLSDLALLLMHFPHVRGLALDPLVALGSAAQASHLHPSPDAIRQGITHLYRTLNALAPRRSTPFTWREQEKVRQALHCPPSHGKPYCHACLGESLAVAPDGRVSPCAQAIGDPALWAGTVQAVQWHRLHQGFGPQRLQDSCNGPCDTCPLAGRCPGDCPSRLYRSQPGQCHATCILYQCLAQWEQS